MDTDSDNFSLDDEGARDMDPFDLIMPMGRGEVVGITREMMGGCLFQVRRQRPVGDGLVRIRRLPPAVHPRYQPTAHREWMPINQERRGRDQSRDIRPHIQNTVSYCPTPISMSHLAAMARRSQPADSPKLRCSNLWPSEPSSIHPSRYMVSSGKSRLFSTVNRPVQVQPVQPAPVLPTYPFAVHQYNPRNLVPFPFYPPQQ